MSENTPDLSALLGGGDMSGLLAQAQALQAQMAQAQDELAQKTVTGSAGGGLVEATMNGEGMIVGVKIKPEAVDPEDIESLEDLITAALRDAQDKVGALVQATMPSMPGFGM